VSSSPTAREMERIYKAIAFAIGLTTLVVVACWALYLARAALLLIYVSMLLAIGFGPIVHAIEHQKRIPVGTPRLPRWLAILVVYVAILGVMTAVGVLVIPRLVAQASEMSDQIPKYTDRVQTFLIEHGLLNHRVTLEEAVRNAPASPGTAAGAVASAVTWTVKTALSAITVLVLTFYLLVERDVLLGAFVRLFARENRLRVIEASRKISTKVSAWLSGQLLLAGTIGGSAAVALYLLDVPFFYVLALVAAVGEVIPVIGPILSSIPAILAGLSVSPKTALFVAIFWLVQQQLENHLLVPKIMQRQLGVNPVVILVALLVGGAVFGILGAVLAVPTAAIGQVIVQEILDEREERTETLRAVNSSR
jgi:predicted PurR-regulated permease PerM